MNSVSKLKYVLTALLFTLSPSFAASQNFETLRYMLGNRSSEPRMYLPSGVVLGKDIELTVVAPGAKSIKVLSSMEEGYSDYEDQKIRLGNNVNVLGEKFEERADFKLNLDPEKYTDSVSKQIFFEALAYYQDEKTGETYSRPVSFYGANAGVSITNGVQVLAIPKQASSSLAASAKTFMPGLAQPTSY